MTEYSWNEKNNTFFTFLNDSLGALFWNWKNILKQNYASSSCECSLLDMFFRALSACNYVRM